MFNFNQCAAQLRDNIVSFLNFNALQLFFICIWPSFLLIYKNLCNKIHLEVLFLSIFEFAGQKLNNKSRDALKSCQAKNWNTLPGGHFFFIYKAFPLHLLQGRGKISYFRRVFSTIARDHRTPAKRVLKVTKIGITLN